MRRAAFVLVPLFVLATERGATSRESERAIDESAQPPTTQTIVTTEVDAIAMSAALREGREPKKVHLKKEQITVAIAQTAARYLDRKMGSEMIRVVDGKKYSFCVEPHYHAPGSGLTPEGWHTGVTVYGFED